MLTAFIVAALAALFTLEDRRSLITNASASLAAVLPAFSAGIGRPAPAMAKPQIAETGPIAPAAPVTTVAVAPTREAIANAYQTALQSQPEIRQPPARGAPMPAPGPRHGVSIPTNSPPC